MTTKTRLVFATAALLVASLLWSYLARPALPVVFQKYRAIGAFNLPVFAVTNPTDSDFRGVAKYEVLVNGVWQQAVTESCAFEHMIPPFAAHQTVEVITAPHIPPNATAFRVGFNVTTRDWNRPGIVSKITSMLRIPVGDFTSRQIWSAPSSPPTPNAPPSAPVTDERNAKAFGS
jgi:hypothetical protein